MDGVNYFDRGVEVLRENFGHMVEMCLASTSNNMISIRDLHAIFTDGKMYVLSKVGNKLMRDIEVCPNVALCHGASSMQGVATSVGHPCEQQNAELRKMLKRQFGLDYSEYVEESNPDMRIVEITLTHAETYTRYHHYEIDFANSTATRDHTQPTFIYR